MPTLTIQLPGLPPVEHILREEAITLGRMKGNTIALDDSSVSLSHAKITRNGDDFFLKDLNSTNGTMLNGQSISEARIRDGDQLKFGEVVAHFRLEPALAPMPASAVGGPAPQSNAQSVSAPVIVSSPPLTRTTSPPLPPSPSIQTPRPVKSHPLLLPLAVLGGGAALAVVGLIARNTFFGSPAKIEPAPVTEGKPAAVQKPPAPGAIASAKPAETPRAVPANTAPVPTQPQSLDELTRVLKSPAVAERRRAAAVIYNLGTGAKEAVPALREALKDSDPDVRMWTALTLINNKAYDKATIPILVQVLHHANPTLRQVACLSLALIPYEAGDKDAVVPALVEAATKDENEAVRKDALTALKIIAPGMLKSE